MAKHIKVRATLLPSKKYVRIHLLEQTHFCENFGINGRSYFEHKNVELGSRRGCYSMFKSKNYSWQGEKDVIYLCCAYRLTVPVKKSFITVGVKQWERIKEAIIAYNKWGATQN